MTAYNEWIQLKEIYRPGLTGQKRRRKSTAVSTEEQASVCPKAIRATASHKRQRRSFLLPEEDDDEDYDDEQDIPLQQLWLSRTKPTPRSAKSAGQNKAPDSRTSPLTRQMNATLQRTHVRDLENACQAIKAHMLEQTDGDGLKIIFNNDIIQRHLNALQKHAYENDEVLFQAMQSSLNQKLMEVGIPALPDV